MIKYVVSAPYSYMQLKRVFSDKKAIEYFRNKLQEINSITNNDIEIVFLLNAFTEEDFIVDYRNKLGDYELFLDSGGLQMVTLGLNKKSIDVEARKKRVYEIQAMYGDYNMSFDEIPKVKVNDSHLMMNASGFVILEDKFYESGLKAGHNLKEQAQVFAEYKKKGLMKYQGKILPIVQNYKIKNSIDYAKGLFEPLEKEDFENISGLSLGGPIYNNIMDSLKFCYVAVNFPEYIPNREILHFLGFGSINRILPFMLLYRNGIIPYENISFDSSKLVKQLDQGQFEWFDDKKGLYTISMEGTEVTPEVEFVLKSAYEEMQPQEIGFSTYEDFVDWSYYWGTKRYELTEKYGKNKIPHELRLKISLNRMVLILYQIRHYARYLDSIYRGMYSKVSDRVKGDIKIIENITSVEQYNKLAEKYDTHPHKSQTSSNPFEGW